MWPMHGMCGATEVEVEVQRTHKRAGLAPFFVSPEGSSDLPQRKWTTKESLTYSGKEKMKCIGPKPKDEDVELLIWEEVHRNPQEVTFLEVKHVNAQSSKKAEQEVSPSERFATECNEKADELVKVGAM